MSNINTSVNLAGISMKNPVTTASGTFGSGKEFSEFVDLNRLGAVTVKGVADQPWLGNNVPRIAETYGGMLNSVGLQNPGADYFIKNGIYEDVDMFELNISCPNVSAGGITFGTEPRMAEKVVSEVRKRTNKPLIVKLTPNVTDITEIAKAAVSGGADAISLINTLLGMRIDINKRKPILANKMGGFSGPAVKPVAVRMVYQVYKSVDVPIVGMGGIQNGEDAIEFIMAGATAVAVGTANFNNPTATIDVIEGIEKFMYDNNIKDLNEIRGIV